MCAICSHIDMKKLTPCSDPISNLISVFFHLMLGACAVGTASKVYSVSKARRAFPMGKDRVWGWGATGFLFSISTSCGISTGTD